MIRNKTSMLFLLFGISIILFVNNGCTKTDYQVKAKWIYINETGHNITYYPDYWSNFNVKPHDTTFYYQDSDGSKDIKVDDYVSPVNALVVYYDNIKCDTLNRGNKPDLGDGPLNMANYSSKKLDDRYYEFTYRFTEKDFLEAKDCK